VSCEHRVSETSSKPCLIEARLPFALIETEFIDCVADDQALRRIDLEFLLAQDQEIGCRLDLLKHFAIDHNSCLA
jgi:hypothetical protein